MDIAVIVPTLNEAENIVNLIPGIHNALQHNYTIVVVDDNSKDGTQEAVRNLSKSYPVKLVARPGKLGLASAVIDGINAQQADAYIIMDADFSHPPELLPALRKNLETYDLVVASRHVEGGGVSGWPLKRRIISSVAILMARPLTRVKDTTTGFFAIRGACLENVKLTPLGFKIGLECFVKANWKSYAELPFIFTDRKCGSSKLRRGEFLAYLKHLRLLYLYTIKRRLCRLFHIRRK
ncbi:MAG: polyprenol monophosphomannose synthase [Dehalococcoidia bacterium]|jgi:dolichol-phosphate mannosyltransferase